jgi:long-chain acyl-CoA synthetase
MKFASFLATHARNTPDKDAIICGAERLTFRELDESTDRLANALRAQGVEVGDRVAIQLHNTVEFARAFMAATKAGAIAVPVNTRLAPAEIAYILADSAPRAVFFSDETRESFEKAVGDSGSIVRITSGAPRAGEHGIAALIAAGAPGTPAVPPEFDDSMIVYTSGTTGKPKGAILTQANSIVPNGYINMLQYGVSDRDRQLVTTPLAHRTGFARMANMLLHGSTLVVMPRFDPAQAAALVRDEKITVIGIVPTVGRMLLPEIEARPENFATVRVVLVTGEAFPLEVKQRIHKALPHVRMYSFFAMTEVGGLTLLGPDEQFTHPTSLGRVNPGAEVRLVDPEGRDVAAGEVGEMWVRTGEPGRYLTMRCYFNKPKETAETIRDGWVATGDMARMEADGHLYIMDRKKDMVLSGGYNIYSKEVELVLQAHPAVQDAAVIGVPDAVFGEAVAAFIELRPGAAATADEVIAHCRDRIAGYKKPKFVRFMAPLPRNSTGKVQKFELRKAFAAAQETTE